MDDERSVRPENYIQEMNCIRNVLRKQVIKSTKDIKDVTSNQTYRLTSDAKEKSLTALGLLVYIQ